MPQNLNAIQSWITKYMIWQGELRVMSGMNYGTQFVLSARVGGINDKPQGHTDGRNVFRELRDELCP
jgi:hypothetical protein